MKRYDVIVIGVGSMGAAACRELARRGASVLGIEQFAICHDRGSHHGQSRMVRRAYHEHPDYVALLQRALTLWRQLPSIYFETGGLYLGPPDSQLVAGSLAAAQEHTLDHELLDHSALASRYPQFRLPDHFVGFHEKQAGFVVPEAAVTHYATQARDHGATLQEREAVLSWDADNHGVTVRTDRETYHGQRAIFCGGAWSGRLLADLGLPLKVTRQTLAWVRPRSAHPFHIDRFPCWAIDRHPRNAYRGVHYGFPMPTEAADLKIALHAPGDVCEPDHVDRGWRSTDESDLRSLLTGMLPEADGPVTRHAVCLYTNSPDGHFIIDRHPKHDRIVIACGFSGHGFKFVPVMGEVLADMALARQTELPVGFLGLRRFA